MYKKMLFTASTLLLAANCNAAYKQVMNGFYGGATGGATYISNLALPSTNILGIGITSSPILKFKIGGNAGLQVGYRFKDKYRVEGQLVSSFNAPSKLQLNNITLPNSTYNISGKAYTNAAFFINGFIDLLKNTPLETSQTAPYFGIGLGMASTTTRLDINTSNALLIRPIEVVQTVFAVQAIAGLNYYIDSYTFIGLDYRVQQFSKIRTINKGFLKHNLNVTMNISFA